MNAFKFIQEYNGSLAVLVAVLVAACGFVHYLSTRRSEERGKQYDRYHQLLEDLNVGADGSGQYLDRQIAVIYELRNFPEYWPVTLRILSASLPRWEKAMRESALVAVGLGGRVNTVYQEARLTIMFIERRQLEKSYLCIADEDR